VRARTSSSVAFKKPFSHLLNQLISATKAATCYAL